MIYEGKYGAVIYQDVLVGVQLGRVYLRRYEKCLLVCDPTRTHDPLFVRHVLEGNDPFEIDVAADSISEVFETRDEAIAAATDFYKTDGWRYADIELRVRAITEARNAAFDARLALRSAAGIAP